MAKTYFEYVGDGTRTVYPAAFVLGYLQESDIHVYQGTDHTIQLEYTWQDSTTIELAAPIATGTTMRVRRIVSRSALQNDYQGGAVLEEDNLDNSFRQGLMIAEEVEDGFSGPSGNKLATGLNAGSNTISNIADGVEQQDAASVAQVAKMASQGGGTAAARDVGRLPHNIPLNTDIVYPVSNVAALRALTDISVGQALYLEGHTVDGVGGGNLKATKAHTTEIDNNGVLFVVDGVVIERAAGDSITLEDFGVDETDCGAYLSAALTTGLPLVLTNDVFLDSSIAISGTVHIISRGGTINLGPNHSLTGTNAEIHTVGNVFQYEPMMSGVKIRQSDTPSTNGLPQTVDAFNSTAALNKKCLLRKLRTDFLEYAAYTPVNFENTLYSRWYATNRFNLGNTGCSRINACDAAELYAQTVTAALAFNDGSRGGTWINDTWSQGYAPYLFIRATNDAGNTNPATVTYTTSATASTLYLRHGAWSNCGIVQVVVKHGGVEIDDSKYTIDLNAGTGNHEVDTYAAVSSSSNDPLKTSKIAEGLAQAVYTIEITVLNSKNASSTGYRYYDYGISTTDGVTAGEIGVDAIIDNPFDRNRWIGTGNLEYAASVRTTTSTDTADSEFVTGTHGLETAPSGVLVIIDGVDVTTAYNAGAIGDEWTGDNIKVSYQTQAEYPDALGTYWATIDYSFTYTRTGVTVDVVREVTNPVRMDTEYVCMLHAPDDSTTTADPINNPLTGIGGGFSDWVVDGDQRYYRPDGYATNATLLPPTKSFAVYNNKYAAIASIVNVSAFLAGSDGDRGVFQKRISENDNSSKAYITTMQSAEVGGDEIPVGHTLTARTRYRVVDGDISTVV